jgi:NitT/TauT family transport system permease protein
MSPETAVSTAAGTAVSTAPTDVAALDEEFSSSPLATDVTARRSVSAGRRARQLWAVSWPKALAVAIALGVWEVVALSGWKPAFVLPGPGPVLGYLWQQLGTGEFWSAVATTLRRGLVGFAIAVGVGSVLGILIAQIRVLRRGVGSLISGLQTMPSIAWFPLALLLFKPTEQAILFVILLGAVPSVINGILNGIDHVPPAFIRLGNVLGAHGLTLYRHVVLPAALPAYVGGLTQGWAFAWRSLMAGELLVIIAHRPSLGGTLQFSLEFANSKGLLATMIVILVIGMLVDGVFSSFGRRMRRKRGLLLD